MSILYKKEHELLQCLYQDASLQGVCNKIAQLLGTPVGVGDFFRNKLVFSQDTPTDDIEDQRNRLSCISKESRKHVLDELFYTLQDHRPHLLQLPFMRKQRMACGIFHNGQLVAFLEALDTGDAFEDFDQAFFESCCSVMGVALQMNAFPYDKALSRPYVILWNYFNESAEHRYNDDWRFCSDLASIKHFQVFWTEFSSQAKQLFDAVSCLSFRFWALPLKDGTIYLVDADTPDLSEKFRERALDCGIIVGTSSIFSDFNELDRAKRQAQCSSKYAKKNQMGAGLAEYNDYKLQDLLTQAQDAFSLLPFCDDAFLRIRDHDSTYQTEYEQTLRTFLETGQSIQATAERLFIHKNTVLYRIGKLRELFGIDFKDYRQLAQLYCSFLIAAEERAIP